MSDTAGGEQQEIKQVKDLDCIGDRLKSSELDQQHSQGQKSKFNQEQQHSQEPDETSRIVNKLVGPNNTAALTAAIDGDQTTVKHIETLTSTSKMSSANTQGKTDVNPVPDGLHKGKEEEDTEDDEFAIKQSPRLLCAIKSLISGIIKLLHMFFCFYVSCLAQMKQYIVPAAGFAVFLLLIYLLDYIIIPYGYNDLPHFPARLQYIARLCVLGLFPVMVSWFVGQSPLLIRLVQAFMRDMFLIVVSFCGLATFHPVEQMHWMFVYMLITTIFRLLQWVSTCYNCKSLQRAVEGPIQLSLVTLVLYTFLSVVGQELGYMDRTHIVKPVSVDQATDVPEWAYPNMCNIVERLFCGAKKPESI